MEGDFTCGILCAYGSCLETCRTGPWLDEMRDLSVKHEACFSHLLKVANFEPDALPRGEVVWNNAIIFGP